MGDPYPETYPIPLDLTVIIDELARADSDERGLICMTPQLREALVARLREARAEVERLRGLVHEAYIEGFEQHCVDFHYQNTPPESQMAWEVSDARAALAGEGGRDE